MKKVERYETYDGKLFSSHRNAVIHINKLYDEALTKLSLKAIKEMPDIKYQDMMKFLDENLNDLFKLNKIKSDITLEDEQED